MHHPPSLTELHQQRTDLLSQIATLKEFRPGSLTERYRKCGKPSCHCANPGDPGHGPSWSLTRKVNGKTVTKVLPPDTVEATKIQIERFHELQTLLHEFTEVNIKICDALLQNDPNDLNGPEGAEKGGSAQSSSRS